jgi:hypothetical protein
MNLQFRHDIGHPSSIDLVNAYELVDKWQWFASKNHMSHKKAYTYIKAMDR